MRSDASGPGVVRPRTVLSRGVEEEGENWHPGDLHVRPME
jgi:hypothetical protein